MERQAKDGTFYTQVGEDQWSPVTRTAKDGTVYKKVGADAWSPLDSKVSHINEPQKESVVMSAARKGAQGATANFSDELVGAGEALGKIVGIEGAGKGIQNAALGNYSDLKNLTLSGDGPTLDWEIVKDAYKRARDKERETLKKDSKDNPKVSAVAELGGALISPINKVLPNASMAKSGAIIGGITGLGSSDAEDLAGAARDTVVGVVLGGGLGKAVEKAAPIVGKGIEKVGGVKNRVGQYFKKGAEELAENATGATRVQAEKFREGSGRYLLDNGIVSFGDDSAKVASKANTSIEAAEKGIDDSLKSLDAKGVRVDTEKILQNLEKKLVELKKDPSQADVAKKVESIMQDIQQSGPDLVTTQSAEQTKRGFNRMAKNWQDPEKGQAGKIAYRAYRDAVEETAKAADPAIASTFKKSKDTFGRLSPIADAAEKRAAQLNQSPIGGLLDTAAVIGGAMGSDDPVTGAAAGLGTALMRRKVSPRIASSMAVTFDKISQQLIKSPEMAQIAKVNPQAFRATVNNIVEAFTENNQGKNFPLPKAADNEIPKKGPDKWANDGIDNILKSQSDIDRETLEKLKDTKKGKELLIEASEAKNKKAMEGIIKRIRSASAKGDE